MSAKKRPQKRRQQAPPRPPVARPPAAPPPPPVVPVVGQLDLDGEVQRPVSHVDELQALRRRQAALERDLAAAILAAHRDGLTFAAIGRALGITRQAVRQRVVGA